MKGVYDTFYWGTLTTIVYNWPNLVVFVLVVLPDRKFKTLLPLQSPTAPTERGSSEAGKSGTIPSDVGTESSL